jgi:hypothetical protein
MHITASAQMKARRADVEIKAVTGHRSPHWAGSGRTVYREPQRQIVTVVNIQHNFSAFSVPCRHNLSASTFEICVNSVPAKWFLSAAGEGRSGEL